MQKKIYAKLTAIVLFIHGFIELLSLLIFTVPSEFIPSTISEDSFFWAILGTIYGVSRFVAGYEIWCMKKWGIILGMSLSLTSMILAPLLYPFGIIDLPLAVIVLGSLLYLWFDNEKIEE